MAFVPNSNWGRLCYDFTWNGVGVSICINFEKASPTATDFQALADSAASTWVTYFPVRQVDTITLNEVTVYDMSSDSAPVYKSTSGLPQPGLAVTDSMSNNSALVISYGTNNRGRSFRGRSYIPGLSEANQTDGLWGSATVSGWLADWQTYIAGIESASGWTHVVASTVADGVDRTTAVLTSVASYSSTTAVRSQRRRTVEP